MSRTRENGVVVWGLEDAPSELHAISTGIPTDSEGGYAGGDSTADAISQVKGAADAAYQTVEGLQVTATSVEYGQPATATLTGDLPHKTINLEIPKGMSEDAAAGILTNAQAAADDAAAAAADANTAADDAVAGVMTQIGTEVAGELNDTSSAAYAALVAEAGQITDPQIASAVATGGSDTVSALQTRDTVLEARDYGVVADGVTDDTSATRALFQAAADWTSNAETGQSATIHFPAGEIIITASNVFADLTTPVNIGLNVVGAGMEATRFKLVTGGVPMWFYDNADTPRWSQVTFSDCCFLTDGPVGDVSEADQHGGFMKITSSGHEKFFKFFRCHFLGPWKTLFHTEGTGNADHIGLFACMVQDSYGDLMYINNPQSVDHEWYNTTATRIRGHGFTVGPNGGADVKIFGGSWVLMGTTADTTPKYFFNAPTEASGLGLGNGSLVANGIKTEMRESNIRLVRTPGGDGAQVRAVFRDCSLHSTPTVSTPTEMATIGPRGHVVFDGCILSDHFSATITGAPQSRAEAETTTMLQVLNSTIPVGFSDQITMAEAARVSVAGCRHPNTVAGAHQAVDLDLGWQRMTLGGPSVPRKSSIIKPVDRSWPYPDGTAERVLDLPAGAVIVGIFAHRPGTGGSAQYQLHIGTDDKSVIIASSALGPVSGSHTIHVQPMLDVGADASLRTLRLWATGDAGAVPGSGGVAAWVEYL